MTHIVLKSLLNPNQTLSAAKSGQQIKIFVDSV